MRRQRWFLVISMLAMAVACGALALADGGGAVSGEGWIRFEGCPLVHGRRNGRHYIYSIGVETPEASRVLVTGHPELVLEMATQRVLTASSGAVHRLKGGWTVAVKGLAPLADAHMEAAGGDDGRTHFHVWWPGHDLRFATDRVTLDDEAAPSPTPNAAPSAPSPRPAVAAQPAAGQGVHHRNTTGTTGR